MCPSHSVRSPYVVRSISCSIHPLSKVERIFQKTHTLSLLSETYETHVTNECIIWTGSPMSIAACVCDHELRYVWTLTHYLADI